MALTARQITARIPHQSQKWVPKCPFLCQLPPGGSQGGLRPLPCKGATISRYQQCDKLKFEKLVAFYPKLVYNLPDRQLSAFLYQTRQAAFFNRILYLEGGNNR